MVADRRGVEPGIDPDEKDSQIRRDHVANALSTRREELGARRLALERPAAAPWLSPSRHGPLSALRHDAPSLARVADTNTLTRAGIRTDYVDRDAPACTDFFAFANGVWLRTAEIAPDEISTGVWTEVRDANRAALKAIVEEAAGSGAAGGSDRQLVGDFYASGMDESAIESAGLGAAAAELDLVDGIRDDAALIRAMAALQPLDVRPGFSLFVRPDPRDSSTNRLHLQQGGLGLPDRDYYLRDDEKSRSLLGAYRDHVERTFALAGAAEAEARERADLVLRLETRLARASMTRVDQRDPYMVANTMSRTELAERAAGFDWDRYFAAVGARDVDRINPRQPDFFAEIGRATRDVAIDEWRVFLRWHVLRALSPYLATTFSDQSFEFYGRRLLGQKEQKPRWERVVEVIDQHRRSTGEALGRLYVERLFPPEAKTRMREMIEHLRAALGDRIRSLDWMSPLTKAAALEKLAAFTVKVGYPDRWHDRAGLAIGRSYLANIRATQLFEFAYELGKLGQPVDRTEWGMTPPTVNAYYNPSFNEIVFPAGILRAPFFDLQADDASNYGAIGVVIGHEMSHGFDDSGSQYDAQGNLRNWWSTDDRASYEARTGLMVQQYDGYEPLPGQHVNGKLTLGENIGDLGGVRIAFAAFQRALAAKGRPDPIDHFTAEQRFFIAHAQVWRSVMRDESLLVRLLTDPHSPPRYRVNGPLSNMTEFHEAFGCSADTGMCRPAAQRPVIW
jgi:predicted metalloendopeptidase